MSALDKALRQIDAQGPWQSARVGPDGARPDWDYPAAYVRPPKSLWMPLALVVLSLALLASCLVIVGWLPGPAALGLPSAQQASLPSAVSVPVPVPTAVQSALQAAVPVGQAAAPAMPVLVQTPTPLNTAAPVTATAPVPALALPTAMVAVPEAMGQVPPSLAQKPTWHKAGSRPWGWGLWDEAARAWLKGLNSQDPGAPLLLIADQQTLLQATRVYARWATEMPVVVLPRPAATAKRWVVLAVPAPSMLEVAQQRLLAVQSAPVRVGTWAQWQMALGLADPAQAPTTASVSGLNTAAGHVPVPARLPVALVPAPFALPGAANAPVGANVAAPEMAAQPLNKLLPENPQLSRTEAERLPASGPVSTAAKAIDVDFQAVEKNLARGEHQAALDAVIKLEKYIGENWRTQYLTGVALMGLARWELAAVALSKAQSLNPKHATTALYLSVTLQERGEHARAIQVLDMAQQLQPLSPELWLNQGHSHQALGHKAEARKSYNRFLELSVNRQDLAVQRVWVQNRLQKDNG